MEEANRIIEEWIKRGDDDVILDLSGLRLIELPESLFGITNLKKINLSNNNLTSLPESISQLSSLKKIRFRK